VAKYRPDDMLTASEFKKRLSNVTLKGNQDPSDLFEEIADIDHSYSDTAATLGTQDLSGTVFAEAPEKYHTVLNITSDIKGKSLDINDLEKVMYNLWCQGGSKPSADNKDNELVMGAFTGNCYVCKEQGHKATDFPSMASGGGISHVKFRPIHDSLKLNLSQTHEPHVQPCKHYTQKIFPQIANTTLNDDNNNYLPYTTIYIHHQGL
jgi:hypothetical protein